MADLFRVSDGVDLFVAESGLAGASVTVVFLHGWTEDHRIWDRVADAVQAEARIIALDFRGHGESDVAPRGQNTLERLADDVAELIAERAPAGPIVLVGHSMGGMTMMALAERHPDLVAQRVAAAMFVSTASEEMHDVLSQLPGPLAAAANLRKRWSSRRRGTRPAPAKPAEIRDSSGSGRGALPVKNKRLAAPILRRVAFGARAQAADVQALMAQLSRAHRRSAAELNKSIAEHNRTHVLAAFRAVPCVVAVGDRDRVTLPARAAAIVAELPDAEHVVFVGAGHTLPYERSDALIRILHRLITHAAA